MRTFMSALVLLLGAGCGERDAGVPEPGRAGPEPLEAEVPDEAPVLDWPTEAERTLGEGNAPTPFTAQQVRDGCWAGRKVTWRIEEHGREPRLQSFDFVGGDTMACEFQITARKEDGEVIMESPVVRATWVELQEHASYPLNATTITEVELETATGKHPCFLYTVETQEMEATLVTKYWFSKTRPGPPLQIVTTMNGEEVRRQTLVSDEDVPPPPSEGDGRPAGG